MKLNKIIRIIAISFVAGLSLWASQQVQADSTEDSQAVVTFTGVLNPSNPNLPVTSGDNNSSASNNAGTSATNTVAVNTTPEKTKVATTNKAKTTATTSTATTSQRRTLPQTGSVELPMILVIIAIIGGLGVAATQLKSRQLSVE